MKIKATSKWFAFVLVALLFVALTPMAVRPATAANPVTTAWIPDQMVSTNLVYDEGRPSIASDLSNLYVAYEYYNTATTYSEIKVAKSTDGGTSWSVIHTKSLSGYNLYRPSIAVDPYYSYIYVVYERQFSSTDWDIWLEKYVGGVWSTVQVDNTSGTNDRVPSITVEYNYGAYNYVYIVYERQISASDVDLWFARSTDHGATWTRSILRSVAWLNHMASIAYADSGIYVAYRYYEQIEQITQIRVARSVNTGNTWTDTPVINYWGVSQPSITVARGLPTVIVAYTYAYTTTDDDIRYSFSQDGGSTWSSTQPLATTTLNERFVHLTVDYTGTTINGADEFHATYLRGETVGARTNGVYYTNLNIGDLYHWSTPHTQIADDNAKVDFGYWVKLEDRAITVVQVEVPVVVWTDFRGGDTDVYATTLGGRYTIDTSPPGLQVRVDGVNYWAPASFWWAYGSYHTLYAPSPQGTSTFIRWSDGGAQTHAVSTNVVEETLIMAYYTPTLTLSLSPTTVARGSPLTISGQLTPGTGASEPIQIWYRIHGTYSWTLATTLMTNTAGAYSATITVPMNAPTGTIDLVAFWPHMPYAVSAIKQLVIT